MKRIVFQCASAVPNTLRKKQRVRHLISRSAGRVVVKARGPFHGLQSRSRMFCRESTLPLSERWTLAADPVIHRWGQLQASEFTIVTHSRRCIADESKTLFFVAPHPRHVLRRPFVVTLGRRGVWESWKCYSGESLWSLASLPSRS